MFFPIGSNSVRSFGAMRPSGVRRPVLPQHLEDRIDPGFQGFYRTLEKIEELVAGFGIHEDVRDTPGPIGLDGIDPMVEAFPNQLFLVCRKGVSRIASRKGAVPDEMVVTRTIAVVAVGVWLSFWSQDLDDGAGGAVR